MNQFNIPSNKQTKLVASINHTWLLTNNLKIIERKSKVKEEHLIIDNTNFLQNN